MDQSPGKWYVDRVPSPMTRSALAAGLLLAIACSGKPSWKEYSSGAVTLQFPCNATVSAAVAKCLLSDGSEFALATVDKGIPAEQELTEMTEYVKGLPKSEILQGDGYPFKWREVRQFVKLDAWLWYVDGKEYTVSVTYASVDLPPLASDFFSRVKVKGK